MILIYGPYIKKKKKSESLIFTFAFRHDRVRIGSGWGDLAASIIKVRSSLEVPRHRRNNFLPSCYTVRSLSCIFPVGLKSLLFTVLRSSPGREYLSSRDCVLRHGSCHILMTRFRLLSPKKNRRSPDVRIEEASEFRSFFSPPLSNATEVI